MPFTRIGYGQVEPNQLSGIKTGQIFASLPLDNRTIAGGASADSKVDLLQNGEFMFYDYASGFVSCIDSVDNGTSDAIHAEPYLVYNEIKIYEDWLSYKDFAMFRVGDNYVTNPPMIGRLTSANADGTVYGDGSLTVGVVPSATYTDPTTGSSTTLTGHTEYQYRMDGIAPRLVKTNIGDIWTTNMVEVGTAGSPITYNVGDILLPKVTSRNTLELSKTGTIDTVQVVVVKVYTMPDGQPGLKVQRIK
jgi:hypothetical protein